VGIGPVQLNGHDRVAVGEMADHQMLLAGLADERRWFAAEAQLDLGLVSSG